MNGEGRLFLTAALRQSAYLTENIANQKQKKILNTSKLYQIRNGKEKIVVNQKEARSAVGMVVDATNQFLQVKAVKNNMSDVRALSVYFMICSFAFMIAPIVIEYVLQFEFKFSMFSISTAYVVFAFVALISRYSNKK